jgi:hypothetical protein
MIDVVAPPTGAARSPLGTLAGRSARGRRLKVRDIRGFPDRRESDELRVALRQNLSGDRFVRILPERNLANLGSLRQDLSTIIFVRISPKVTRIIAPWTCVSGIDSLISGSRLLNIRPGTPGFPQSPGRGRILRSPCVY